MKKILLFLLFIVIFINPCFAEKFYIENYDINIKVSPSNVMDITEIIDVNFTDSAHGIIRNIPYINHVKRQDGSRYDNTARIQNVKINAPFSRTKEDEDIIFKIGDSSKSVLGRKTYIIKYEYILSENAKNQNEFYFNVVGNGWNTDINHVNFKIDLPKDFDKEKVGVSVGQKGTAGFKDRALFVVSDKTISGSTTEKLLPNEGITVRAELPNNYFDKSYLSPLSIKCILIAVLLMLLSLIVWVRYGKDNPIIPIVSFIPPKGLDAPKVGALYKEGADKYTISVLILDLASKGYIKIEEEKSILPFGKNYCLHKIKEYDKKNREIHEVFDAMFRLGDKVSTRDLIKSNRFLYAVYDYAKYIESFKKQIYEKESTNFKTIATPLFSTFLLFGIMLFICNGYDFNLVFSVYSVCLLFPLVLIFAIHESFKNKGSLVSKIFLVSIYSILTVLLFALSFMLLGYDIKGDWITFTVCLVCYFVSLVCLKEMQKKSIVGQKILGQILGFRKFLQTVEKNKIELIMKKKPNYCYSVIPYAFALGVGGDWIKKIQSLTKGPSWYIGEFSDRNLRSFNSSFCSSVTPAGSSSGGGGSSGGGSGGGGGSSW